MYDGIVANTTSYRLLQIIHSLLRLVDTIMKAKGAKRAKNEALYGEAEDGMNVGTKLR